MPYMKRLLSIVASHLLLFCLGGLWAQSVDVTTALQKNAITQHEPVLLDITIRNNSQTSVRFDPGYKYERIGFEVTDPEGRLLTRGVPVPQEGMTFSKAIDIAPAASGVISLLLDEWFTFDKIGDYKIDITVSSQARPNAEQIGEMKSRLTLKVLPRDQPALESRCADLVRLIENSQTAAATIVAAKALAGVSDPAAVPFLAQALRRREFAGLMIAALARVGTTAAVDALVVASRSNDPETNTLAKSALLSIGVANSEK